jgi:hypothetical protein
MEFVTSAERRLAAARIWLLAIGAAGTVVPGSEALAETRLRASYEVTLGGLQVGTGGWTVDVSGNRYSMEARGRTSGLVNILAHGSGSASAEGTVNGTRLVPTAYKLDIQHRSSVDQIRIALAACSVKTLIVEPAPKPSNEREPLTESHKKGVLDPISAGVLPGAGADGVGPGVCSRTLAVFDGRQRFDLALSFKRIEMVRAAKGYSGPVVVCGVRYEPLGGYYPGRASTRVMRESREMEAWYAPISGTPFVATYRLAVPTVVGTIVLQATSFEISGSKRVEGAKSPLPPRP